MRIDPRALEKGWAGLGEAHSTLINLSENHTFRLDLPNRAKRILRVHRPGYQDEAAIRSELNWIAALRKEGKVPVPQPLRGRDGAWVQQIDPNDGAGPRHAVLFEFETGIEPDENHAGPPDLFFVLGQLAALCHEHVRRWQMPDGFVRPSWTVENMLTKNALWGNWRDAPNVRRAEREVLELTQSKIGERFSGFGRSPDRFGLIHADMRLANLLVDGHEVRLLDFDDSGFGWFIYDFAAAISFYEDNQRVPHWRASWCEGYRSVMPLPDDAVDMIDTAIMLRRMLLLAWVGSHGETELAQSLAPHFAQGTVDLAHKYLAGQAIS